MLYHLFTYLHEKYDLIGAGVFQFISFRTSMTVIFSLIISLIFGNRIINYLQRLQIKESVRNLGLEGQIEKQGTPTMGGLIILSAVIVPVLLFARLNNIYVILMLISAVWLGLVGFLDDYIKIFKNNKKGLAGKFKVLGQVGLGLIIATAVFFHPDVIIRETFTASQLEQANIAEERITSIRPVEQQGRTNYQVEYRSTKTTIPFVKHNEFDYAEIMQWIGIREDVITYILYTILIVFIITAVSNGVNITDGLDGLAAGLTAIVFATLAAFAWVSGNAIFSDFLNIMFIPNSGELVIVSGALVGGCVGFLWYNAYPARVFMGDTGSLALGGMVAVMAILVRKELLIPVLCGVFLVENLSVIIQVAYFKYTKKKYGEGKRIFKMSPLHHHYQKSGYHESKIVSRFWIIGVFLALITIITLKLR